MGSASPLCMPSAADASHIVLEVVGACIHMLTICSGGEKDSFKKGKHIPPILLGSPV